MVSFSVDDIFTKEWQELDVLFEDIEKGKKAESALLENETFLHILSAVKAHAGEFRKIPSFIQSSKIFQKYCKQYNLTVTQFIDDPNVSSIDVYKRYLMPLALLDDSADSDMDTELPAILSSSELSLRRKEKIIEYDKRDKELKLRKYARFCEYMKRYWKTRGVEEQLVREREALIYGGGHDMTDISTSFLRKKNFIRSEEISRCVEPKVHDLQNGCDYYRVVEETVKNSILTAEFDLPPELFRKFMEEKHYKWELAVEVSRTELAVYYDEYAGFANLFFLILQLLRHEWLIVSFRYVLKITC